MDYLFLGLLSDGVLVVGLVLLASAATLVFARPGQDAPRPREIATAPALVMKSPGAISPNREARALFGLPESETLSIRDIADNFRDAGGDFEAALHALTKTGRGFRGLHVSRDDRTFEAIGEPNGRYASITFTDQTEMVARLKSLQAEVDVAQRKNDRLISLVRELGAYIVSGEDPLAIEESDSRAHTRRRLLDGAAAVPRDMIDGAKIDLEPESDASERAIFELRQLGDTRADAGDPPLVYAKNITAAVAAEQAMNQLVYTMSETFAHLKVGLLIFDADLRLTLFNPAIVESLEEDAAWLATRPPLRVLLDRLRQARNLPEQSDYPAWRDALLERIEADDMHMFEENWLLPDGRSIHALFRPHPSGGLAVVVEDVTESLVLRRKSASERAVSHATTELLDEGIAVFGPDGMLRLCNPAFRSIWNLSKDFCANPRHVSEVAAVCTEDWTKGDQRFWELLKRVSTSGERAAAFRKKVANAEGRTFIAKMSYAPDGSMLAVFAEITAEEKAAAALIERNDVLEQADEMRSALVDQISHQIRTPLNSVLGFGQLLGGGAYGDLTEVQREYVDGIVDSARDIVEAIDGMSDLILVDANQSDPASVPVRLEENVGDVLAMVERRFNGRAPNVVTTIDDEAKDLMTEGRRGRLRQILFNLVLDGATKCRRGERIFFDIGVDADTLILRCSYSCDDNQERVGLALSLVRRFTRLFGGEAIVERGDDGVSSVTSRLPVARLVAADWVQEAGDDDTLRTAKAG